MSENPGHTQRSIGLFDATSIGVGAIVGGGILALAGTAFAATGPGAVLAFLLNGLIALTTALSFTELATAFPQSGGTYLFAKRVVSVGAAFNVGWVVWFASIVAAALYALGFAAFALDGCMALWPDPPGWLASPPPPMPPWHWGSHCSVLPFSSAPRARGAVGSTYSSSWSSGC